MSETTFDEWVILELMGHRRLGGKVTELEHEEALLKVVPDFEAYLAQGSLF